MTILIDNKRAHFNYEILDKFEAGIELMGHEVKAIKNKQGSLDGSYIIIRGGEAFAVNVFVPPYQEKNTPKGYDPRRNRKLLLERSEIMKLSVDGDAKGLTIVPISVYSKNNLIKVSVAVVKGKKKFDKRETIKLRETERTVRREFVDR